MGTIKKQTVFVLTLMTIYANAIVIHVDISANGGNTGADWSNAFTNLQSALAGASEGDEIWVAQGTYRPGENRTDTFQLRSGVAMYGGFASGDTFNDRDWTTKETILSGDIGAPGDPTDNCYHVVSGTNNVHLSGFIIRDGFADGSAPNDQGAGYHHPEDRPGIVIENCVFEANMATNRGGAVYIHKSVGAGMEARVTDCTFVNNAALRQGGAIAIDYQSSSYNFAIEDSTFIGNKTLTTERVAMLGGGAINFYNCWPLITNCAFSVNQSQQGAAVYSENVYYRTNIQYGVIDCVFSGNTSLWSGGALMHRGGVPIRDCVFMGNTAPNSGGAVNVIAHTTDDPNLPHVRNLYAGNRGDRYGGAVEIYGFNHAIEMANCVFSHNEQTLSYDTRMGGGGLISRAKSLVAIRNTLFHENKSASNSRGDHLFAESNGTGTVAWCAIEWNAQNVSVASNGGLLTEGDGNIPDAPGFAPGPSGQWTADAVFDPSTGLTTLTDATANWSPGEWLGMGLNPDVNGAMLQYSVTGNSATSVQVLGDATTGLSGKTYRAHDYHLLSGTGRWQPGLDEWVTDAGFSPCIDAGDPADDYSDESKPDGRRINIGLYGGTAFASRSPYDGTIILIR